VARDYKRAASQKRNSNNTTPGWLLFVAGLSIGLFCTLLVYLQMQPSSDASTKQEKLKQVQQKMDIQIVDIDPDAHVAAVKKIAKTMVKTIEEKVEKLASTRPRFDFYTILPELEVLIPAEELKIKKRKIKDKPGLKNKSSVSTTSNNQGAYVLQAGSFKSFDQADRRKAKLALLSVTANIQRVTINDNEVWYRVRIGPFSDLNKLNKIRVQLFKQNINAIPLKVKR